MTTTPAPMPPQPALATPTAALLLVLAPVLALAGCAEDDLAITHLVVDFGGRAEDIHADVRVDLSSRPAQATYDRDGIPHPDAFTAHDQLAAWAQATRHTYAATGYQDTGFGAGYFLTAIDGVVADGASAYWALSINGESSMVGMSEARLRDGDTVLWTYTPISQDPAGNGTSGATTGTGRAAAQPPAPGLDPNPLGVTVDPPAPTRGATATVTGSVNQPALVSVGTGPAVEVAAGRWELTSPPLPYGRTEVTVRVEDGVHDVAVPVTFVRLAPATIEAVFTASPGHASKSHEVWYDLSRLSSAPMYEGSGAERATTYSVHDLMVDWTTQTGTQVEYSGPGAFGFGVEAIDGVGQPLSSSLPPYWCYELNGESAQLGISLQTVAPGDVVTWEYGACA